MGVTSSLVMKLDQEEVVMFAVLLNIISCKEITEPRNNSPIACKAVIAKLLSIKQLELQFWFVFKYFIEFQNFAIMNQCK